MSRPQSNSSPFHSYGADGNYANYYDSPYLTSESISYQAAPYSINSLPSDLPDLYYDQELPSPPSATSSNIISTPPPDWLTPWQQTESNHKPNNPAYLTPSWPLPLISCQGGRPTVASIDTNFNRKGHAANVEPSILFATSEEFDMCEKLCPYPLSYPQAYSKPEPNTSFEQPSTSSVLSSYHSTPNFSPPMPPNLSSSNPSPSQATLKIHQPRPSRRIPIISLSKLASACDTFPLQTPQKDPKGKEVTRPLFLRPSGSLSMHRTITQDRNTWIKPHSALHPTNGIYTSLFPCGTHGDEGKVLSCNCGCQESYIFT
jgi:hypothetical protein